MRDLIDFIQLLAEDRTLSASTIKKRPDRFEKFISMIVDGKPFYTVEKQPVVADPAEADRFQELFQQGKFEGSLSIKLDDGTMVPLSKLLKTAELGGQASTGEEGEETGKEAALLKPSQIGITDKNIPAKELGDEIINNTVLQSTEYGRVVIEMAKSIVNGQPAVIPKELLKTKIGASIHDYAGEYLGVLALVNGQSRFPRKKGFTDWLGADVTELTINFPSKSNTNIADSFASIENEKTNHKVNISSKGSGGGAPPSVGGLKVPEEIRNNPMYKTAVDFIDLADPGSKDHPSRYPLPSPRTISQVFQAMNLIYQESPESIPKKFAKFLPWKQTIVQEVVDSINAYKSKKIVPMTKYQSLWKDIDFKKDSSDGGKLVHATKLAVMQAVNEGRAIPNFQEVVLAILDMNFVQQYADLDKKTGVMSFATQWPAKLEGNITLESKSGATDPTKGGFSFKLSNTAPKTELEQSDEGGSGDAEAGTTSDVDFAKAAAQIAEPKSVTKPSKPADVGRTKRK